MTAEEDENVKIIWNDGAGEGGTVIEESANGKRYLCMESLGSCHMPILTRHQTGGNKCPQVKMTGNEFKIPKRCGNQHAAILSSKNCCKTEIINKKIANKEHNDNLSLFNGMNNNPIRNLVLRSAGRKCFHKNSSKSNSSFPIKCQCSTNVQWNSSTINCWHGLTCGTGISINNHKDKSAKYNDQITDKSDFNFTILSTTFIITNCSSCFKLHNCTSIKRNLFAHFFCNLVKSSFEICIPDFQSAWSKQLQSFNLLLVIMESFNDCNFKSILRNRKIILQITDLSVMFNESCDNFEYCHYTADDYKFEWKYSVKSDQGVSLRINGRDCWPIFIFHVILYTVFLCDYISEKLKLILNENYLCRNESNKCDRFVFCSLLRFAVQLQPLTNYENTGITEIICAKPKSIIRVYSMSITRVDDRTVSKVGDMSSTRVSSIIYRCLTFSVYPSQSAYFQSTSSSFCITIKSNECNRHICNVDQTQKSSIKNCLSTLMFKYYLILFVFYSFKILIEMQIPKSSFTKVIWSHNFFSRLQQVILVFYWSMNSQPYFNCKSFVLKVFTDNTRKSNSNPSFVITNKTSNPKTENSIKKYEICKIYHIVFLYHESYAKTETNMYLISFLFHVSYAIRSQNCYTNTIYESTLFLYTLARTNATTKSNYLKKCSCIRQHALCAKRSKSNYINIDITKNESNTLPSVSKTRKHKIRKSPLQNLSVKISFFGLLYNHCVNITFKEKTEFRGQFLPTIKHRRRGKTKGRAVPSKGGKNFANPDKGNLEIKVEDSLESKSRRREKPKDHNKHGGTILNIRFLLLLAILCFMIGTGSASCPRLCACKWKGGKQTVECINKGLTTIPSDIDPGTQVLDMTGNPLVIISREKFKIIGLTNLQRIYATRCKLVQLDDSAFRGLSNLVELDLSINELRVVPAATLQFLPSLMRLQLSFNPITHIKDGSFGGLAYLTSLELTGCAIHSLESLAFQGLDRLEWLKINDNNLTTVPPKMMLPKSLHGVDMHNNPWTCDCKLRQLRQWLVQYNVPSSIEPKCAGPLRLKNRIIKEVIPSDLACAPEMRPASLFLDIIEGKNVSFECHVTAVPDADVQWLFNGYPLENSTFAYEDATSLYVYEDKELDENKISYLRIETVTEAHTGIFQCIAENQAGRMVSNFTLRVSLPPTKPAPSVPPMDHIVYIGTALISLVVLVIILFCILIIRCCRRRSKQVKHKPNSSIIIRDKQINGDRPKSNNMPKYIQMGTPAPKVNGILADTPPISVIENSPYRTEPVGSTHMNPDIIADGPDDRSNKPAKKKVSIIGVEEMDANGMIITRKLDDIIEESEDNFDPTYEKIQVRNGYENTQALLNNHYVTLTRQQVDSATNQYPLTELPPDQVPQQNVRFYDQQGYSVDYVIPREQWQDGTGRMDHVIRYSSPVPTDQSPLYSTLRRNRQEGGLHSNVLHDQKFLDQKYPDQKYSEEYNLQECNHHFQAPDMRYQQSYGLIPGQKKVCESGNTFCECCQPTTSNSAPSDYDSLEPLGRMRGDGCSFDHLLTSCGGQCCYDEKTGQLFDNTLPENYRPLEENPPPPPEGYGDSEDEVDMDKAKEWRDGALSPGTRVLYSPPEESFNGTRNEQQTNVGITNV